MSKGKRPALPDTEWTPEPSPKRARLTEIADHLVDVVGVLLGKIDDRLVRVAVMLDRVVLIGRSEQCDVVLDNPSISKIHLRISPVRTNTSATLVTVSDLSQCGFMLNGVYMRPEFDAKVGGRRVRCKTFILKEHDWIGFLNCPVVFTFYQGIAHKMTDPEEPGASQHWVPVFADLSPSSTYSLVHWTVNNVSLGAGAFGAVNLASHRDAPWLQVACKTMAQPPKDEEKRRVLDNEVMILNQMRHHNVNGIIDMIEEEVANGAGEPVQRFHLILELMCGGDLFAYHDKHGALSELEIKWIAWQMVNGLQYLHENGVAHRDLKPENILLSVSAIYPRIVIGDFGHAVTREEIITWTPESDADGGSRPATHVGTLGYIPPERLKQWLRPRAGLRGMVEDLPKKRRPGGGFLNRRETLAYEWFEEEARLDSWALGVTLYILAVSLHPYEGQDPASRGVSRGLSRGVSQGNSAMPSTSPLTELSHKSMTPSQSWRSFRSIVGEGSRLGSTTFMSGPLAAQIKSLHEACRGGVWLSALPARGFSDLSCKFFRQLFEIVPHKRLRMVDAHNDAWFVEHQDRFLLLQERVVKGGEVLDVEAAVAVLGPEADPKVGPGPALDVIPSSQPLFDVPDEPGPSNWAARRNAQPLFFERDDSYVSESGDDDSLGALPTVHEEDEEEVYYDSLSEQAPRIR